MSLHIIKQSICTLLLGTTLLVNTMAPALAQDNATTDADSIARNRVYLPLIAQNQKNASQNDDDPTKAAALLTFDESKQFCTSTNQEICNLPDSFYQSMSMGQESARAVNADSYVGVIPASDYCPPGADKLKIYTDDEDRNNANSSSGWIGAIQAAKNTTYVFCKVNGDLFKPLLNGKRYAVLSLSDRCPNGARRVERFQDNEDNNNGNWYQGNIYPNVSNRNTKWVFCDFNGNGAPVDKMAVFPDLFSEFSYGVFGAEILIPNQPNQATGARYTDDEDSRNANSWNPNDISPIIFGTNNTDMRIAKVR